MRRVDSMDDIWHLVSKGSKLPNVLKISIFNTFTKRNGSLFIFDLLEPQFIELSSSVNTAGEANTNGIGNCFDNLRKQKLILCYKFNRLNKYSTGFLIRTIAKSTSHDAYGEPVITDYYFLTHTLSKFVCSQGQLVVFAHLNVSIVCISCDFIVVEANYRNV